MEFGLTPAIVAGEEPLVAGRASIRHNEKSRLEFVPRAAHSDSKDHGRSWLKTN